MTDKNRRFLVAGTAAGLASTLLAGAFPRPALAWTDQDFAPVRRRRSRDPVQADDGAFYDTRGQAADPYYRSEPAPAPESRSAPSTFFRLAMLSWPKKSSSRSRVCALLAVTSIPGMAIAGLG